MKQHRSIFVLLLPFVVLTCSGQEPIGKQALSVEPAAQELDESKTAKPGVRFLSVDGQRFVDADGRQVILHGLNVISKSKAENYLSWHGTGEFQAMRQWGMNCVRLGIIWDGIEPEPGQYNEEYLDGVARRIEWATDAGLFVFLDMHQDLFSAKFSDGAPPWATLDEGKPHNRGAVWSDSYLISPAVQASFDSFWANRPAPDGIGVQDHYAAMWAHVAARFAGNKTVIAYDIMNEPFEGSSVLEGQRALLQSEFAKIMLERLGDKAENAVDLAALWMQPDGRALITQQLEDVDVYKAFLDAQAKSSEEFERESLMPMYQRVARAIRQVDTNHLLFLEAGYHTNAGVYSHIEPVVGQGGRRDRRQAYAPHAYDIVVDTPQLAQASTRRVELIFGRHAETATRLGMPMVLGEYGAFGNAGEGIVPSARVVMHMLEKMKCGDTYWDFGRKIEDQAYFETLNRPIPLRIAGKLIEYESDPENLTFSCRWQETDEVHSPTIIYLPKRYHEGREIRIEGDAFEKTDRSKWGVYLQVISTGSEKERILSVR